MYTPDLCICYPSGNNYQYVLEAKLVAVVAHTQLITISRTITTCMGDASVVPPIHKVYKLAFYSAYSPIAEYLVIT